MKSEALDEAYENRIEDIYTDLIFQAIKDLERATLRHEDLEACLRAARHETEFLQGRITDLIFEFNEMGFDVSALDIRISGDGVNYSSIVSNTKGSA